MRALLLLAFALVLLVVVCSATLRLAGSGIGCTPWPVCYAQASTAAPPDDAIPEWQRTLRLTHRISATMAGLVFVFIIAFGYGEWSASQRVAGVSLLLLAVVLALVGRITPSQLPAVVLANLIGGHLLLAALAWLLTPSPLSEDPATLPASGWHGGSWFAGVLLVLVSGTLVSVRGAAAACADGCAFDSVAWLHALAAWNPWRAGNAGGQGAPVQQGLLQMHAVLGTLVALGLALTAWRMRHRRGVAPLAAATALAALTAFGLGFALALPAAAAHSVLGGLTLAGCAALWRARRRESVNTLSGGQPLRVDG